MGNNIGKLCSCTPEGTDLKKTTTIIEDTNIDETYYSAKFERRSKKSTSVKKSIKFDIQLEKNKSDNSVLKSFKYKDNSHYIGSVQNGLRCGNGKYLSSKGFIYDGEWLEDLYHGKGVLIYDDIYKYEGEFENGLKEGYGKITENENVIYEGFFHLDKKHGKGKEHNSDGSYYVGEFKSGLKEGKGEYYLPDGSFYIGEFADNQIHGKGEFKWADGNTYKGEWKSNSINGLGVLTKPGKIYKGYFENDKKSGLGLYYYSDRHYLAGRFLNNHVEGLSVLINGESTQIMIMENNKIKTKVDDSSQIENIKKSQEYKEIQNFINYIVSLKI